MEAYGIEWHGPLPQLEPCESTVDVPETQSVLSDQEMFRLLSLVDPLSVIVMELICTCRLELLSLPVNLSK